MNNRSEVPTILVLSSLNATEQNGELVSPRLHERVMAYEPYVYDMWHDFQDGQQFGDLKIVNPFK
jgi:hypothetical protein